MGFNDRSKGDKMTPQQEQEWEEECDKLLKTKGYVPAEVLMIPMLLGLAEAGLVDIGGNDEYTVISTKGILKDKK